MDTKVLKLEVDLGDTRRAPVAEIANYYTPEQEDGVGSVLDRPMPPGTPLK